MERGSREPGSTQRSLGIWPYIAVVVAYLVIIQGFGLLFTIGIDRGDYGVFTRVEEVVRGAFLPVLLSAGFVIAVIAWLRWWPTVLHDDRPVARWLRIVPIAMLLTALAATNYGNLADQDAGLVLIAIVFVVAVGIGEELTFRGLGVDVFRRAGFTEAKVALYTSLIFGAAHLTNAISSGAGAILQAAVVSVAGYFLYLTRRVSGGLLAPICLHAVWDFSLFSGTLGDPGTHYAPAILAPLCLIVLAIVVWVRRKRIEPAAAPT